MGDPVWKAPDAPIDEEPSPATVTGADPEPEDTRPLGPPPWKRIAVSAAVPLVIWVMGQVTLPGLDPQRVASFMTYDPDPALISIGALGVRPYVTAFVIVELLALFIPAWRARRNGGIKARADLRVAVGWLAIAIAILQSWTMVRSYEASGFFVNPELATYLPTAAVLIVATLMIAQLATIVDKHGFGSGFSIILITGYLQPLGGLTERVADDARISMPVSLVAIALTSLMTWAVLTGRTTLSPRGPSADVRVPIPASGVLPIQIAATAMVVVISVLPGFGVELWPEPPAPGSSEYSVLFGAVATITSIPIALIFNQGSRVADAVDRFGLGRPSPAVIRSSVIRALATTAIFIAVLVAAHHFVALVFSTISVCIVTAIATDLAAEWIARRRDPDLAIVRPEHRPYAVAAILATLRANNIPALARGLHHRTMLQFFGPYVPIDVMVPASQLTEAKRALLIEDEA